MVDINIQTYEVEEAWYRQSLLSLVGGIKYQVCVLAV